MVKSEISNANIRTDRVGQFIVITSKVARETFLGDMSVGVGKRINVQEKKLARTQPVEILLYVNLQTFEDDDRVKMHGRTELTPYDREVHDACVSHALLGNEYITESMIYDTICGRQGATLTDVQRTEISNALTKMMYTQVTIDASKETEVWGAEAFIYDGPVLPAERVRMKINGVWTECIHLFRVPPLYEYANRMDQIDRIKVDLLDSPVKKNGEVIVLQGFLYRRVLAKKRKANLSPTILYDTIYRHIGVEAESPGALRKKKCKVRSSVKRILDYWVGMGYVKGFEEIRKGKKTVGITIKY